MILESQKIALNDWKAGRPLDAKNLQEAIDVIRAIQRTLILNTQVSNQPRGLNLYRVTEVVDIEADPITWFIKAVRVNDQYNEDTPPVLEEFTEDINLKLPAGTYGVAVGDLVTDAIGAKESAKLVIPIRTDATVYKTTSAESGGEITIKNVKLDGTTVGDEFTVNVLP